MCSSRGAVTVTAQNYAPSSDQIEAFRQSANRVSVDKNRLNSIGTLGERMLHAVLKGYICPDAACHEQKVDRYHADILRGREIYEVQTRRLDRLRPKLETLLDRYEMTVVYPIAVSKTICWLDPIDGSLTAPRKSPRHESLYDCLYELFYIKDFLTHPNFHFRAIMCEMEEFKLLNGYGPERKYRAHRAERIPVTLVGDCLFSTPSDYAQMFPPITQTDFTSADFCRAAKLTERAGWRALQVFRTLGLIRETGKRGRAKLYTCGGDFHGCL